MKLTIAFIVLGLVVGILGQPPWESDWIKYSKRMKRLNENLHRDLQAMNHLFRSHQRRLSRHMMQIREMNRVRGNLANSDSPSNSNNAPPSYDPMSTSTIAGRGSNGLMYRLVSEDRIIDGVLHHVRKIYDVTSGRMVERKYTLNLSDLGISLGVS